MIEYAVQVAGNASVSESGRKVDEEEVTEASASVAGGSEAVLVNELVSCAPNACVCASSTGCGKFSSCWFTVDSPSR